MTAPNLNDVRALLNQALCLLNAADAQHDDGGGGTKGSAVEAGGSSTAQSKAGWGAAEDCSSTPGHFAIRRKQNQKWSQAEEALLLSGLSTTEVAARTGRTVYAAWSKKKRLLDPGYAASLSASGRALIRASQSETTPAPANWRQWAPNEDQTLNNPRLTDTEIALRLGRSYRAVRSRRFKLLAKQSRGAI